MATQEQIAKELALFQLNTLKKLDTQEKAINEVLEQLSILQERVLVLENARQRQIKLNSEFSVKEAEPSFFKRLFGGKK